MVGKRVASRTYAHASLFEELPEALRGALDEAIAATTLTTLVHFNVARIDVEHQEVSLLDYPDFFEEPFPALAAAWRVHLPTRQVTYRDYRSSLNPPILHRKELLLPVSHPARPALAQLTSQAESIGLFDDPVRIGFRRQWEHLIGSRGYSLQEGQFVPLGNAGIEIDADLPAVADGPIERHKTALSRTFLSAPVQALIRTGVLRPGATVFDYGCGRGSDLDGLHSLGYDVAGWDPHYRPTDPRIPADIVNLGFVINVIEDLEERIVALQSAYALARGALSVAAMLGSAAAARGRPYRDGILTSRNTFQRYYDQSELGTFIEAVLDEHAHPVAPGVFFVFRDRYLEQRFLLGRHADATRAPRLLIRRGRTDSPRRQQTRRPKIPDPRQTEALRHLWKRALELGRLPDADEFSDSATVTELFGSWKRALNRMLADADSSTLEAAAVDRTNELRVYFAMQALEPRRKREVIDPSLKRDVRAFFGSATVAVTEGLRLLRTAADPAAIMSACERAATQGLGFLDGDHALQLHTSLVPRLEPVLRAYVASATVLYGDISNADLVKIHIQSGKVTLMKFDDFVGSPLPRLMERVKVKLRDQDLDFFEYGRDYPPPLLYFKSRYINEEFENFPEQLAFDQSLRELQLLPLDGYGPTEIDFTRMLKERRLRVHGFELLAADDIPDLDSLCGATFTYRQLIECGDTWHQVTVDNRPQQPATYNALYELATRVLDPVVDYFGAIELTYGFASAALTKHVGARIAPTLDQHSGCEVNARGQLICSRRGAAVDFLVRDEDMREVAKWIRDHCQFDRLYFYGVDRPIHVSVGPDNSAAIVQMVEKNGRRIPRPAAL